MISHFKAKTATALLAVAATTAIGGWWATTVSASDHDESPLVKQDAATDITDLYVFGGGGKTTIIVCWGGFNDSRPQPDTEGLYSEDVLYTLWIDNNGDNQADHKIYWRYGRDDAGAVGIQWEGIPGADPKVAGPVETVFDGGDGSRLWSGHADDPFFFDVQGYLETLDTGTLSITSDRDTLAGLNVTAAAIEIDTALIQSGASPMQFWVTTASK